MLRTIDRLITVPPHVQGFVGPGHLAAPVVAPGDFARTDPFIALMDDRLDIGHRPVGGPHPHAGFETVTLILDGAIRDRDEGGTINTGEVQWMTAGRGIIHGENVEALGRVHLLQLWLTLPKNQRWTTPDFQDIHSNKVPIRREAGVDIRIYSGASGDLHSTTRNYTPVTIAELTMEAHSTVEQDLPASYNGFIYVLHGSVRVGSADGTLVNNGQVGWLDRPGGEGHTVVRLTAGSEGARLVLYAGEPQSVPIVSHGPFIADSDDEIRRLYAEYRAGTFERMSALARAGRGA